LDVQLLEPAVFVETEAGNRIVAAIRRKQKPSIRREENTSRALEGVRCAFLAADRLERSGTGAGRQDTLHLGQLAIRRQLIVDDGVLGLVRLYEEMPATRMRFRLSRGTFR